MHTHAGDRENISPAVLSSGMFVRLPKAVDWLSVPTHLTAPHKFDALVGRRTPPPPYVPSTPQVPLTIHNAIKNISSRWWLEQLSLALHAALLR